MIIKLDVYIQDYDKNFSISIGRNQYDNDTLIKKSNPNDIWFHLDNISGPHIVLHTDNLIIPKRTLNYIGTLFQQYKSNLPKKYTVIYTCIKNIKTTKTPGSVNASNTKRISY